MKGKAPPMSLWQAYLADIIFSFKKYKEYAEKAFQQIDSDDVFFHKPGEHSNSLAIMIKHVAGNLRSRFTDLLTTDGDKPWRNRDGEFVIGVDDSRAHLLRAWDDGWAVLFDALGRLQEGDLLKTVPIRGEPHTVFQALHRALSHTAYHVGQIAYLSRLLTSGEWKWITVPPGQSNRFKVGGYLK
jgi:hypothetical protein